MVRGHARMSSRKKVLLVLSSALAVIVAAKLVLDVGELQHIRVIKRETGEVFEERRPLVATIKSVLVYQWHLLGKRNELIHAVYRSIDQRTAKNMNEPFSENREQRIKDVTRYARTLGVTIPSPYPYTKELHEFLSPNDFFTREYKKSFLPVAENDEAILAMAESRTVAFESLDVAKSLWIKGEEFTLKGTGIQDPYLSRLGNPSVLVHRLAPSDYHRFLFPVSGKIVFYEQISDDPSHSVQPSIVRSSYFNIFNTNKRSLIVLENPEIGIVFMMAVGAIEIDSIVLHKTHGEVQQGEEAGYFQYGGSCLVVFFQQGQMQFDEDILKHSRQGLETMVRIGSRIGVVKSQGSRF